MIQLQGVAKRYAQHTAVAGIDLQCREGETHAILGPSGCGKSTLLKIMLWLIRPDRGVVTFDGVPITAETTAAVRRRTGYVIQEGGLFPHLTAAENVALMPHFLGWDAGRTAKRLDALADLTRLDRSTLDRYPREISGGQRQRASIMRALMLDPDVLLMDEPMDGLDPIIRANLQSDLREIFRRLHKTVVLVTHDLGEARYLADRITLLQGGRIVQQGTFEDLVERPTNGFVTEFVSAQRRNWQ